MKQRNRALNITASFLLCSALPACFGLSRSPSATDPRILQIPTKDDIALVDGHPLSLTGYHTIQALLKSPTQEMIFWVGVGALALQNDTRAKGRELGLESAVTLARYAINDLDASATGQALQDYSQAYGKGVTAPELRAKIDQIVSHSLVQRNPQALSELH